MMHQYPFLLHLSRLPRKLLWLTILIGVVLAAWRSSTAWAAPVAHPHNQTVPAGKQAYLPLLTASYIPPCDLGLELDFCNLTNGFAALPVHTWSPDGHTVAFIGLIAEKNGYDGFYTMDEEGKNLRLLFDLLSLDSFSYSPDGTKIVLRGTLDYAFNQGLYLYTLATEELRSLTDVTDPTQPQFIYSPAWSPDSGTIIFSRQIGGGPEAAVDIYSIRPDGSELTQLTDTAAPLTELYASYSPDGQHIVYVVENSLQSLASVGMMKADGSEAMDLTSAVASYSESPSWTKDSRSIFFVGGENPFDISTRRSAIYKIGLDGNNLTKFTPGPLLVYEIAVSPDGSKVLFQGTMGLGTDNLIYTMDIDGSNLYQYRIIPGGFAHHLQWHPDSRRISYWESIIGDQLYLRPIYQSPAEAMR